MITALEIENFKGIAARQRIEFAPLTLLFGANSAGKSTILQALLYISEVLSTGHADIDRTELGGRTVDLGGFGRLVHRHETARTMCIRVEFKTAGGLNVFRHVLERDYLWDLNDQLTDAWVELCVGVEGVTPRVTLLKVGSAGDPKPLLYLVPSKTDGATAAIVYSSHPLLKAGNIRERIGVKMPHTEVDHLGVFIASRPGTLVPALDEPISIAEEDLEAEELIEATQVLEMLSIGVLRQLVRVLRRTLYLGPLRAVPARSFLFERSRHQSGWADGMAAWDALLADTSGKLATNTNKWLSRLGARCEVRVQDLFDPNADAVRATDSGVAAVRRLVLNLDRTDVLPAEMGTGVSQLIPVVVAALVSSRGTPPPLILIEQPELHVHPALQVALGDLFIEHCGPRRQFVIETHSEHLILRILRRIRQTTDRELPDGAPEFSRDELSVLYAESVPEGARISRLRVDEHGEFVDKWPKGFFDERAEELF